MTPEELDRARADEADRIFEQEYTPETSRAILAARLAREGWTPPVKDPDVLAFRGWLKAWGRHSHRSIDMGELDDELGGQAYLAGCTRGREGTKGLVAALDWYADPYNYLPPTSNGTTASVPIGHDGGKRALAALASAKRGG